MATVFDEKLVLAEKLRWIMFIIVTGKGHSENKFRYKNTRNYERSLETSRSVQVN